MALVVRNSVINYSWFFQNQGVANQTNSANGSLEITEAAFPILEAHPLLPPNVSVHMEAGTSPLVGHQGISGFPLIWH